jgi:hypothetical protein
MNNNSLTIAAIAVLAALLATGAVISSEIAFAGGHHYSKSVRQTVAQDNYCGSGTMPLDVNCQNLGSQVKGNHNAVNVISVQPSRSGVDHGNDHKDDGGSHDDHGNNPSGNQGGNGGSPNGGNGGSANGGNPSGNQGSNQGGNGGSANGGNPSGNHAGSSQGGNPSGNHAGNSQGGNPSGNHAGNSQGGNQGSVHAGSIHLGSNPVGNPSIGAGA